MYLLFIFVPILVTLLSIFFYIFSAKISKNVIVCVSFMSSLICFIFGLLGIYSSLFHTVIKSTFSFISVTNLSFDLGIYIDLLGSVLISVVELITSIIFVYSSFYLNNSDKNKFFKFYLLMNIFNFSILGLICSPGLFQILVFWELLTFISYLLVGFYNNEQVVSQNAKRVLLINIIGDICLFTVFIIISVSSCLLTNSTFLASVQFDKLNIIIPILLANLHPLEFKIISLLLVTASLIKSAQFPFNSWLINAMSAPTPVSALIHSSTLVMAGTFLLLRFYPLIIFDHFSLKLLFILGIITSIITSVSALIESNIKKILAYSTASQFGIIFMCLGYYNPVTSLLFLISHAFIKVLLFMCAGIVIKVADGSKNIFNYGYLRHHIPTVAICFIIASLALSGIGFCGFSTKSLVNTNLCISVSQLITFGIIGALTTLYIFRLYFITFEKNNNNKYDLTVINKNTYATIITMTGLIILLTFALPSGKICVLYFINLLMIPVANYLYNTKLNFKYLSDAFFYKLFKNGLYLDNIYHFLEYKIYKCFSLITFYIDYFLAGTIEYIIQSSLLVLSDCEHKMQTNNFQIYIVYSFWIFLSVILVFLWIYLLVQNLFGV